MNDPELMMHELARIRRQRDDADDENSKLRELIRKGMEEWLREPDGNAYQVLEQGLAEIDQAVKR